MKQKLVLPLCIITPSYNQSQFIEETIVSVINQGDQSLYYGVIDGGSTDGTVSILRSFTKKIFWISEKDKGQTAAINKGIKKLLSHHSNGIFGYINSDDYYLPFSFQRVRKAFSSDPNKMWLVSDAIIVDKDGREIHKLIRFYKRFLRFFCSQSLLCILNPFPQPAVFVKLEAFKELGEFDESLLYAMDYEYWLRLYKHFGSPLLLSEPLAAFRIHDESKGMTRYKYQFKEELKIAKKYTANKFLIFLHYIHILLIEINYSFLKS